MGKRSPKPNQRSQSSTKFISLQHSIWKGSSFQLTKRKQGKVVKEGYLTKQGKVRKTWKKRLCVLDEESLQYYRQSTVVLFYFTLFQ